MMLGYPEVRADLKFESIPTVSLEQRIGVETITKIKISVAGQFKMKVKIRKMFMKGKNQFLKKIK